MQWEGFSMYDIESVKGRFVGVKMIIRGVVRGQWLVVSGFWQLTTNHRPLTTDN